MKCAVYSSGLIKRVVHILLKDSSIALSSSIDIYPPKYILVKTIYFWNEDFSRVCG
jgi:hypothetical protein